MKRLNQSGSHILLVSLGIVIAGVIGFTGYRIATRDNNDTAANASTSTPDKIENKEDLQKASESLDSSGSEIDSGLNTNSLDDDLNDLL